MALQFAFHLGSLAFVTTLIHGAIAGATFTDGMQSSATIGLAFFGIGFALGKASRHLTEELAARELAALSETPETDSNGSESTAGSKDQ